jgi:hypothetical protein
LKNCKELDLNGIPGEFGKVLCRKTKNVNLLTRILNKVNVEVIIPNE